MATHRRTRASTGVFEMLGHLPPSEASADDALLDFNALFGHSARSGPPPRSTPRSTPTPQKAEAAGAGATTSLPVLELKHFATAPSLDFGGVPPRSSSSRALLVRNDTPRAQRDIKIRLNMQLDDVYFALQNDKQVGPLLR